MRATDTKLNVLFVDDDPLILQGLKRMLRPMKNDWSMTFVESGTKALQSLEAGLFHVVVSDMRMPGMNGAQLLAEIQKRHPDTVRLILSGHADKDLILQCIGTAHQFLLKPCDPETIRNAIARASTFDTSTKSQQIRKLVSGMSKIPSIPSVYSEMVEKVGEENASIEEIGSVIAKDPGISAKLLKLVNSAFFGLCREVSNPADAAAYLGIETMKALVLSIHTFESFKAVKCPGFSIEKVWNHSLEVANMARKVSEIADLPKSNGDESFIAAILHDVGKLLLADNKPVEYQEVIVSAAKENVPVFIAEDRAFGANHADVAGFILNLWGLPQRVIDAIALHHTPESSGATTFNPVISVHIANALVHEADDDASIHGTLNKDFLASIGVKNHLADWKMLVV